MLQHSHNFRNFEEITRQYNQKIFWGISSSVDLKECSLEIITSAAKIKQYIIEVSEIMKVTRFGEPQIICFGHEERIKGYTFTQMIETSLVAGHFVDFTRAAYLDVFSCSLYNPYEVASFSQSFFQGKSSHLNIMLRE